MNPLSLFAFSIRSIGPHLFRSHIDNICRLELLLNQTLHKVNLGIIDIPEDSPNPVLVGLLKETGLPACRISGCRGLLDGPVEDALFNVCWERVGELGTQLLLRIRPHLSHLLI